MGWPVKQTPKSCHRDRFEYEYRGTEYEDELLAQPNKFPRWMLSLQIPQISKTSSSAMSIAR